MANYGNDVDPFLQSVFNTRSSLVAIPEHNDVTVPMLMSPSDYRNRLLFASQGESSLVCQETEINDLRPPVDHKTEESDSKCVVRKVIALLVVYVSLGVSIYWLSKDSYKVIHTNTFVDGLYFCVLTMCTNGYGDITPDSVVTKLFSVLFVFVGFGLLEMLISGMRSYLLDQNKNGRRMRIGLGFGVVVFCFGFGVFIMHFVEEIGWLDSFYFSMMSVSTVGYGDGAFKTMTGRLLAAIWLLLSTLALILVFLFLAEARVDHRNSEREKRVLGETMSVSQFIAADIDNVGSLSKAEFLIYQLKKMEKITDMDIIPIAKQFDKLDQTYSGRITLSDLTEKDSITT